jgi:hypothetical protein
MPRKVFKKEWSHDALVADLANWLQSDEFVCGELRFGPAWFEAAAIPDVLKIRKSYKRWDVQIYECKAHRNDFLGEIRSDKWKTYLPMSSRFYFATPYYGVIKEDSEIPEGCGWIVRGPNGWKVKQTPRIREFTPDPNQMLALLMAIDDRLRDANLEINRLKSLKHIHNAKKNAYMKHRLERVEQYIDGTWKVRQGLISARDKFLEITGLPADSGRWDWLNALERRLHMAQGSAPVGDLKIVRNDLKRALDRVTALIPPEEPAQHGN